jgi:hypothetical protein
MGHIDHDLICIANQIILISLGVTETPPPAHHPNAEMT